MIGTTLAHYEVVDKLGEGGMGEVYRARDTRLGREVAIKVIPEAFLADPERLGRFEREARLLASLNHPHIAAIHGVEEVEGRRFLVLELVAGETLAERLGRGPIPVEEALELARQVAEGLEAAHGKGIVHRDLKPANVKVTPEGGVKVLDFGLAKALEPEPGAAPDLSRSPTLSYQATRVGVVLGTAAYMSPEQARGKPVDRRADIWAFGCLLYQMLTARSPFGGETVTDVFAAIVTREPDWEALPRHTPRAVRRLLRRCLEKDPARRLHDVADARLELEEAQRAGPQPEGEEEAGLRRRLRVWRGVALASGAALLGVAAVILLGPQPWQPAGEVVRTIVPPPAGGAFHLDPASPGPVAVAPDGRQLAYSVQEADGTVRLWVRELGQLEARPLPGTEGAAYPFWAPDGRRLAYFAGGSLRRIDLAGGPPTTLCKAPLGKGGTWSHEGVLAFAPGARTGLFLVPESGGEPTPLTELDRERGDTSHRHPRFLPDGRRFLFVARQEDTLGGVLSGDEHLLLVGSRDGGKPRELMKVDSNAEYAAGHLLFARGTTLMAVPVDGRELTPSGEPFPLAEGLVAAPGAALAVFSASDGGVLAYQTGVGGHEASILEWRDRQGNVAGTVGGAEPYTEARLSPDGTMAAVGIAGAAHPPPEIWLWDFAREVKTRFTFDPGDKCCVAWSPQGDRLAWASAGAGGRLDLYAGSALRAEAPVLLWQDALRKFPSSWAPDGRQLLYFAHDGA
ncbi:MAG TPA: protein kinase, partial [Thermoanaerobaculia bacterium]|nr:protein kinase [Thermoanaerobaculia bacterium]